MSYEKTFNGDGSTFGATYEAEAWLTENGYSFGPSCIAGPQGIVKGDAYVSKWHNMTYKERSQVDGELSAGRDRPAIVRLKVAPEFNRPSLGDSIERDV